MAGRARFCIAVFAIAACMTLSAGCATVPRQQNTMELAQEVASVERAFARTMAERDFAAFTAMLSEEAVFFSGPTPLRGKQQVSAWWKRYYEKPDAPFSWEPEHIEVLASGRLALSSGPVRDRKGNQIGTFTSIWRLEAPGTWRIVFDKGDDACECARR